MLILVFLDAVVVFVNSQTLLFRLALAILCSVSAEPPYSAQIITGHFLAILPPFQSAFN